MAPKAPIGAAFMTMAMTPNIAMRDVVDERAQRRCRARRAPSARSRTGSTNSSTCRMSPAREGADHAVGNDVQDEIDRFHRRRPAWRKPATAAGVWPWPAKPAPGCSRLAIMRPSDEREGRHDFEIDQRLDADAADLLRVLDMRDARHHRAEDDRRDHHADQLDEAVAERLDPVVGGDIGQQPADQRAEHDARSEPGHKGSCRRASRGREGPTLPEPRPCVFPHHGPVSASFNCIGEFQQSSSCRFPPTFQNSPKMQWQIEAG